MYGSGLHVWLRDGFSWRTLRNNFVSQIVYLQYICLVEFFIIDYLPFTSHSFSQWSDGLFSVQFTRQPPKWRISRWEEEGGGVDELSSCCWPQRPSSQGPQIKTQIQHPVPSLLLVRAISTLRTTLLYYQGEPVVFSHVSHEHYMIGKVPEQRIPAFPYFHGFNVLILLWGNLGTRPYNNLMFLFMGRKFRGWMAW